MSQRKSDAAGVTSSGRTDAPFGQRVPPGLSDKGKALYGKLQGLLRAPWNEAVRAVVGTPYCSGGAATKDTVNTDVFRDLHQFYVEYSRIEPLEAIQVLRRFIVLADHLEVQHNLFTANWLWEAGRRQLGTAQRLRMADPPPQVKDQLHVLFAEAEQFLLRGVMTFEIAVSNPHDTRAHASFDDGAKRLMEAGLRTCLGYAHRQTKGASESAAAWQRAASVPSQEGPLGAAFFVGLANFGLAALQAKSGTTSKWKSYLTAAIKAFEKCGDARMLAMCQSLLAEKNPAARADDVDAHLDLVTADFAGDALPQQAAAAAAGPQLPPQAVAAARLMEEGKVAEALEAARAADKQISDSKLDVAYLQSKVTLKVLEVQACCQLGFMKAAEKACRDLHNAVDRCEGHVDPHPLARSNVIWRQLKAECFSRQAKAADALRMLQEAVPFAEQFVGPDSTQIAGLMVDCIICRLELHMSGKAEMVEELQADMDRGVRALKATQPPPISRPEALERWAAETKLNTWLHVWRGLQAVAGDGLDIEAAARVLDAFADQFQPDRPDEPMAAWQAAGHVLMDDDAWGFRRFLPWIQGMGYNFTTLLFASAILIPFAVGLFLILYALELLG